jgi:MFS family permease
VLLIGAFSGTISATSSEVGAFLTVEQAILPQTAPPERRTWLFSIYDLASNFSAALGALYAASVGWWTTLGLSGADAYRPLFFLYAMIGLANVLLVTRLSEKVELAQVEGERRFIGVHQSQGIVIKLSCCSG